MSSSCRFGDSSLSKIPILVSSPSEAPLGLSSSSSSLSSLSASLLSSLSTSFSTLAFSIGAPVVDFSSDSSSVVSLPKSSISVAFSMAPLASNFFNSFTFNLSAWLSKHFLKVPTTSVSGSSSVPMPFFHELLMQKFSRISNTAWFGQFSNKFSSIASMWLLVILTLSSLSLFLKNKLDT